MDNSIALSYIYLDLQRVYAVCQLLYVENYKINHS